MIVRSNYGHPLLGASLILATTAALTALPVADHVHGETFQVADGSRWTYHSISTLLADGVFVLAPDSSQAGRYLRATGFADLSAAVDYTAADAAALITVPTSAKILVVGAAWEVTTAFTGGSSSAIGLSSSNSSYSTKGDLLGGSSGNVAAGLTAGWRGAVGTKVAAGAVVLVATDTVRFDRITSVFTAGVAKAHVFAEIIANPGV
jgi:hypothetical protein